MKQIIILINILIIIILSNKTYAFNPEDIFKIEGLRIGQVSNDDALTGVTVLRFDKGAVAAADVRGGAPTTLNTSALKNENLISEVHAIVLSGGSAFGVSSMQGVMEQLENENIGFKTKYGIVPIVTGAVLYDLGVGDSTIRPDYDMGKLAAKNANRDSIKEGNVGAGTGATVGKIAGLERATKGGLGVYGYTTKNGITIAAIVAVNAWGDVIDGSEIIAGTRSEQGDSWVSGVELIKNQQYKAGLSGQNTTLGVIVTNAKLDQSEAAHLARLGHDGMARAINPVHSLNDGDVVFVAATGEVSETTDINTLGVLAAQAMQNAIYRAVLMAKPVVGLPSVSEVKN